MRRRFIDTLRLTVKGGAGGMGLPKYGGVGGDGGNVYVKAIDEKELLRHIASKYPDKRFSAAKGDDSKSSCIFGQPGEDKVIGVPVGVSVYDGQNRLIGELNKEGEKLIVARGGPGGSPSSVPEFCGLKGESQTITLDLKLIADVGLVGFPNAGKSTLLKLLSRAKPKIASYPFTTIRPNLGVIQYPDKRKITIADLPGLIEGASVNVGMGHKFLKHVERTKLLLLVVDIAGFRLGPMHKARTCLETVILLNKELELYKEHLLDKPALLCVNKLDLPGAERMFKNSLHLLRNLEELGTSIPEKLRPKRFIKFEDVLPISAAHDPKSKDLVKDSIRKILDVNLEYENWEEFVSAEEELLERTRKVMLEAGPQVV